MNIINPDYSLYLVTDSSIAESSPSKLSFLEIIREACKAGVGIVQLREKTFGTRDFIARAKEVHAICKEFNVPLVINDRVDVALACGCEGVHIGQGDMDVLTARCLLGNNKIIGATVGTIEQALKAHQEGADYLGIGACFGTSTKKLEKIPFGPRGLRAIIKALPPGVKSVVIGGIKAKNTAKVLSTSRVSKDQVCSGVAVVSEIMAAKDVGASVKALKAAVSEGLNPANALVSYSAESMKTEISLLVKVLRSKTPLVHHITNFVVMNDTANATLCLGASPIMAQNKEEAADLSKIVGSLLLNYGTLNTEFIEGMMVAGSHANSNGVPIILDPVGAGATTLRKSTLRRLTEHIKMDVIKGNAGEISALGSDGQQIEMRGVDSVGDVNDPSLLVSKIARQEKCVIAMTGVVDYVSDGESTYSISNGHEYLGRITGSGCMATTAIASYLAVSGGNPLVGTIAGLCNIGIAAELAAARSDEVKGPSSFKTAFLDELYLLTPEKLLTMSKISKISSSS